MASMSAAIAHSRKKGWIRNPLGEAEPQVTDAMLARKPTVTPTVVYHVDLPGSAAIAPPAQLSMAADEELVPGVIRKSMTPDFIRKSITPASPSVPDYKSPSVFPSLAPQPAPVRELAAWPKDDLLHEYVQYRAAVAHVDDVIVVRPEVAADVAAEARVEAPTASSDLEAQYAAPRLEDAAFVPSVGGSVMPPKPRGWFAWLF
jgi:hypothetical protein